MKKPLSFFLCWLPVCWIVLVGASIGVFYQAKRITSKPQELLADDWKPRCPDRHAVDFLLVLFFRTV